jgi:hypothetical protein
VRINLLVGEQRGIRGNGLGECNETLANQRRMDRNDATLPGLHRFALTLDGYAASHRVVREMKAEGQMPTDTKLRSSKYLNNLIKQDHRGVKARIGPMLGFKRFRTAAVTTAGIELLRRIRKGQFNLRRLRLNGRSAPAIWNVVLAA